MKAMARKSLMVALLVFAVCALGASNPKQASAKTVSKVKKVFTLTRKNWRVEHELSINKNEKVLVKVKFLKVKGKPKLKQGEELYFGDYICCEVGMGSMFASWTKPKLKKKSFKKGKVLKAKEYYLTGKSMIGWDLPRGIKKLKVRVTYYTESGNAGIKSVKLVK